MAREKELENEIDEILRWFHYGHLPAGPIQDTSKLFSVLALTLSEGMACSEQLKLCLYDLLRAKDCAVRAAILSKGESRKDSQHA